jgi:hypothetical protein
MVVRSGVRAARLAGMNARHYGCWLLAFALGTSLACTDEFPQFKVPYTFRVSKGLLIKASGRWWSPEVSKEHWPLGAVDIECFIGHKYCIGANAHVFNGILFVDATPYDIKSWTENQIVFEPDAGSCGSSQIVLDLVTEKATMLVVNNLNGSDMCKKLLKGEPERYTLELKAAM